MSMDATAKKYDSLLVFVGALIFASWLHYQLGMDGFWDTANYHIYLGWSVWNAPAYQFGAAAQYQSFLNPLIDGVNYALFTIHPYLGAAFHAVCLALAVTAIYRIAIKAIGPGQHRYGPVFAAASGATGAMVVSLFGSFTNEHITALLILFALGSLTARENEEISRSSLISAGLLMGIAAGLKLTAAPYVAGLLVMYAVVSGYKIRPIFLLLVSAAIGLILIDGIFMVLRWHIYHNPIFPLANNIFHSPYFAREWKSFGRFEWHQLPYYLSLPVRWLYSGDTSESIITRDGRIFLGYIGLVLTMFSWLGWILFFRIYRYLVVLEFIAGIVFVVGVMRVVPVTKGWLRVAIFVMSAGFLYFITVYPDWGRRPWYDKFETSEIGKQINRNKADVVFFADQRVSYLAADLNTLEIPFANLFAQSWYDGDRLGNPVDPKSITVSGTSHAYFLQYSSDDPRVKSPYLARLFTHHVYKCNPVPTNMVWNPLLCNFQTTGAPDIAIGQTYDHTENTLFASGWSPQEANFRWSDGRSALIKIHVPELPASCQLSSSITGRTFGKQSIQVTIADEKVLNQEFTGPVQAKLKIDREKMPSDQSVDIRFNFPNAVSPGPNDARQLAFAIETIRFDCD